MQLFRGSWSGLLNKHTLFAETRCCRFSTYTISKIVKSVYNFFFMPQLKLNDWNTSKMQSLISN